MALHTAGFPNHSCFQHPFFNVFIQFPIENFIVQEGILLTTTCVKIQNLTQLNIQIEMPTSFERPLHMAVCVKLILALSAVLFCLRSSF